jgi:nucleotide-binding universal stress UspA family protein
MFQRILLAVDGTESGRVAASFVSAMARERHAEVRVVYVNEFLVGGRGFTRLTLKEAQEVVDDAVRAVVMAGVPASGEVRLAYAFDMPSRIVEAALDWGADVIVLGSRRHPRLGRIARRLAGLGMREKVTALTALPTVTAPAPLRVSGRHAIEAEALPADLVERPPTHSH